MTGSSGVGPIQILYMRPWPRRPADGDALRARASHALVAWQPGRPARNWVARRAQAEPDGEPTCRAVPGVPGRPRSRGDCPRLPATTSRGVRPGPWVRTSWRRLARRRSPAWEAGPGGRWGHRHGDLERIVGEWDPDPEQSASRDGPQGTGAASTRHRPVCRPARQPMDRVVLFALQLRQPVLRNRGDQASTQLRTTTVDRRSRSMTLARRD